ncbi:uncharacterized protein EV420DRAFT_1621102 [Desarmillaria tabescens]|uniref:Uncharacterized protein n=1 Tax=Armillaria tabescens TaxID=1929756 RepID=A0AA39N3W0_ARMTA|nr:uncharacterized protein EV420DRAFT_1621102 [Desarmillaria tabescens]KAK0457231.1 hypothetical protein EV420DRAFT_1621102 [Desarmillaria tabescens]
MPYYVRSNVFVPPVLYPHAGTVWTIRQHHNVAWSYRDLSNAPVNITNRYGRIVLRKGTHDVPILILAEGFDILLGRVEVTVPWVIQGDDYSLILWGDSGNYSQNFTITGADM